MTFFFLKQGVPQMDLVSRFFLSFWSLSVIEVVRSIGESLQGLQSIVNDDESCIVIAFCDLIDIYVHHNSWRETELTNSQLLRDSDR